MAGPEMIESRVRGGIWRVLVRAEAAPRVVATSEGRELGDVAVAPAEGDGLWLVSVPIAAELIGDGVRTVVLRDVAEDRTLGHLSLSAGLAGADGLAGEVDLLRAELELLKRAFRRHCRES